MEANANLAPQVTHQPSLLGGAENMKLLFDVTMLGIFGTTIQGIFDNQINARQRSTNSASFDNARMWDYLDQGQQTYAPIRTAAADSTVQQPAGAAYPPIRNVDQGAAAAQTGMQAGMQSFVNTMADFQNAMLAAVADLKASLVPVITTAAGGASTPSQTKPPTTGAATTS